MRYNLKKFLDMIGPLEKDAVLREMGIPYEGRLNTQNPILWMKIKVKIKLTMYIYIIIQANTLT